MAGLEALIRWNHPTRGLLTAGEFIPRAEHASLIRDLGSWVLHRACAQLAAWDDLRPDAVPLTMAVNLSARQLDDPEIVATVRHALDESGIDPSRLILEVTETAVITDAEAASDVLRTLSASGVLVAIDDFGTGYASLTYLRRLPADIIKIDRSFVDGLGIEAEDTTIVAAVMGLARQLRLAVTAEGVETYQQLHLLREMGCAHAQGFLLATPLSRDQIPALFDTTWPISNAGGRMASPAAGPFRVVIADDDDDDRILLRRELERDGRFEVVGEAADGEAAVELTQARRPQLVILDLKMPRVDGLTALPRILVAAPGARIAFLSSYATPQSIEAGLAQGAIGFYTKGAPGLCDDLTRHLSAPAVG